MVSRFISHLNHKFLEKIAGTVVDSEICHPAEFDFFLCSQSGGIKVRCPQHHNNLTDFFPICILRNKDFECLWKCRAQGVLWGTLYCEMITTSRQMNCRLSQITCATRKHALTCCFPPLFFFFFCCLCCSGSSQFVLSCLSSVIQAAIVRCRSVCHSSLYSQII